MRGFRLRHGNYVADLGPVERQVIAAVVADVGLLLGEDFQRVFQAQDCGHATDGPSENPAVGAGVDGVSGTGQLPADPWPQTDGWKKPGDDSNSLDTASDPALARLFPSASADDTEVAQDFEELTTELIRAEKVARLRLLWGKLRAPGRKLTIARDHGMDAAAALNDVRLVLATRLGIDDEAAAEDVHNIGLGGSGHGSGGVDEVTKAMSTVYTVVSWLQETLMESLTEQLP